MLRLLKIIFLLNVIVALKCRRKIFNIVSLIFYPVGYIKDVYYGGIKIYGPILYMRTVTVWVLEMRNLNVTHDCKTRLKWTVEALSLIWILLAEPLSSAAIVS